MLLSNIKNYTIASYSKSDTNGPVPKVFAANGSAPFLNIGTGAFSFGAEAAAQLANPANRGAYSVQNDVPNARELIEQHQVINTTTWRATDNLTVKNIADYSEFKETYDATIFGEDLTLPSSLNIAFSGQTFALPTGALAGRPVD